MSKTWVKCLDTLKDNVPLGVFSLWIQPLQVTEVEGKLDLYAPHTSALNYINKNLKPEIKNAVAQHDKNLKIYIGIKPQSTPAQATYQQRSTPLLPDYTFENLVVGDANQVAFGAAKQIAENIKASPYNPFIIYGESGLGKTHIMQAAGHYAKNQNPNIKVLYVPLIDFVRNVVSGLRHKTIETVKSFYQTADLLLVDDIHLIATMDKSQEEFFHIFNFLFSTKKQIILTCDQPPKSIKSLQKRLKTRLSQGLVLQLSTPELEMRAAILINKANNSKIGLDLSADVALFIASHIDSNVRDLEGALLKLKAFVDFSQKKHSIITKEVVENALGELIKPPIRNADTNDIQKETAKHYAIIVSDLSSKSRKQHIVRGRQMAIFITHQLTDLSLTKIGKHFGNRDHSTVLHAIKKITKRVAEEEEIKSDYELIKLKLAGL